MKTKVCLGFASAALAVELVGCDQFPNFFLGLDDHRVVLSDKPLLLDTKPTRLASDEQIKVVGVTTELCATISNDPSVDPKADGEVINARFKTMKDGAHLTAVLHARDGKDYEWKGDSWSLSSNGSSGPYHMEACLKWECLQAPPKGTEIASIDLSSDRPLRVLGVHWSSTDAFDSESQPPADPFAVSSAEYKELEQSFGGQAAWVSTTSKPALQVTLESHHQKMSLSHYRSTLLLRMSDSGIQLEPVTKSVGMGIVTIPTSAVEACSMSCFGKLAKDTELLLPKLGIKVGFLNTPELIDWCWNQHVPMATNAATSAWLERGTPLPAKDTYTTQFESRTAYDHQAHRSCMGY